jgi:hypothetical protein
MPREAQTLRLALARDVPPELTLLQEDALAHIHSHLRALRQEFKLFKAAYDRHASLLPEDTRAAFEQAAKRLWEDDEADLCVSCQQPIVWRDEDGDAYCQQHARAFAGRCCACRGLVKVEDAEYTSDAQGARLYHACCTEREEGGYDQ